MYSFFIKAFGKFSTILHRPKSFGPAIRCFRCISFLPAEFYLVIAAVTALVSPAEVRAQQTGEGQVTFASVRLTVEVDPEIFLSPDGVQQNNQLETVCKVWREAWLKEQGPWGFGIASDVNCRLKPPDAAESFRQLKTYDHWLLTIQKIKEDNHPALEVKICRNRQPAPGASETGGSGENFVRCEAQKTIPWSPFAIRFVRHRTFVRLWTTSLIDQLPFLSVVGRNLIHYDKLGIRGLNESGTPEVSIPPPPKNVFLSDISFDTRSNKFAVKNLETKEAISRVSEGSRVVWILSSDGRGARSEEINRLLKEAFNALTAQFQLDVMLVESSRMKSDVTKLKAVSSIKTYAQMHANYGLPFLSMQSAAGGVLSLGVRTGSGIGARLASNYSKSKYALGTDFAEKDAAKQSVTSNVNLAEYGFSFHPQVSRRFAGQASMLLEADFLLTSSNGDLTTEVIPPQPKLALSSREFSIGAGFGVNVPVGTSWELSSNTSFDLGWTSKSTSAQAGAEVAWIPRSLPSAGAVLNSVPLRLGTVVKFSSLGRRFVNSDTARLVETTVTLNGIRLGLFAEKTF
jgi:hypothetical protein